MGICAIGSIHSQERNVNYFPMDYYLGCLRRELSAFVKAGTWAIAIFEIKKSYLIRYQPNCILQDRKARKTRTHCDNKLQIFILELCPTTFTPFCHWLQYETRRHARVRNNQWWEKGVVWKSTWAHLGWKRFNHPIKWRNKKVHLRWWLHNNDWVRNQKWKENWIWWVRWKSASCLARSWLLLICCKQKVEIWNLLNIY